MKVTYIHHSGFFVEQEEVCFLFDYWTRKLPEPKDKPLFIFVSHGHTDHFSKKIFEYGEKWKSVHWVISDDIPVQMIPEELLPKVTMAAPDQAYELTLDGKDIYIKTLLSTDLGVAYLIHSEGKTIYHAGDLHLWLWREDEAWDREKKEAFELEIEKLVGTDIDIAFLPLDPRQGRDGLLGLDYTARKLKIKRIYPMHFANNFNIIPELLNDPISESYRSRVCNIREEGQTDEI